MFMLASARNKANSSGRDNYALKPVERRLRWMWRIVIDPTLHTSELTLAHIVVHNSWQASQAESER